MECAEPSCGCEGGSDDEEAAAAAAAADPAAAETCGAGGELDVDRSESASLPPFPFPLCGGDVDEEDSSDIICASEGSR